jgi:ATP adenylyltransferase
MEYVAGKREAECIFCRFASLEPRAMRESFVLLTTPHAVVCLNRYPFASSHLLVAPRRHVADLSALDDAEYAALMDLVRKSAERVRAATNAQGLNIGFNIGKAAGAGIDDHLHASPTCPASARRHRERSERFLDE